MLVITLYGSTHCREAFEVENCAVPSVQKALVVTMPPQRRSCRRQFTAERTAMADDQ